MITTNGNTEHWHVLADPINDTGSRAFPEALTEQQARDLADALADVDGGDVWDAVWVHTCPVISTGCTFWQRTAAFDPDTAQPHWVRA